MMVVSGMPHLDQIVAQIGADGFVAKPLDLTDLVDIVQAALAARDRLMGPGRHLSRSYHSRSRRSSGGSGTADGRAGWRAQTRRGPGCSSHSRRDGTCCLV